MKQVLITALCSAVLLAGTLALIVSGEQERLQRDTAIQAGKVIEQGARLYGLHCRTCHGSRGEGVGQLGPALGDRHFFTARLQEVGWQSTLEEYIVSTTTHGRLMGTRPIYAGNGLNAVMPPWHRSSGGMLRTDEIADLTAFIVNWEATATGKLELAVLALPEQNLQDPRTIARGEQVFGQHCARCHQHHPDTASASVGPNLGNIALAAAGRREGLDALEYIRESILIPAAHRPDGYTAIPEEQECGAVLAESELAAVIAFLSR
ncbi:MAG: cytochrome c [Desulforhopalus sp.]|jgi:mono/diheme cytochrome c family protein|nr:cytochrome c [Desulforhopalus sp.]